MAYELESLLHLDVSYKLESLLHASVEVLGKGWLGTTCLTTLKGGVAVVTVKRLREVPILEKEFRGTVAALGMLRPGTRPKLILEAQPERLVSFPAAR